MNSPHRLPRFIPLVISSVALGTALGGCTGPSVGNATTGPVVTADYYQVQLTGSYIPVKIPKSPTAQLPPTISPLVILTPDDFSRAIAPAALPMH